jgi:cobalamin biosynthesis protein CobD/CbiB
LLADTLSQLWQSLLPYEWRQSYQYLDTWLLALRPSLIILGLFFAFLGITRPSRPYWPWRSWVRWCLPRQGRSLKSRKRKILRLELWAGLFLAIGGPVLLFYPLTSFIPPGLSSVIDAFILALALPAAYDWHLSRQTFHLLRRNAIGETQELWQNWLPGESGTVDRYGLARAAISHLGEYWIPHFLCPFLLLLFTNWGVFLIWVLLLALGQRQKGADLYIVWLLGRILQSPAALLTSLAALCLPGVRAAKALQVGWLYPAPSRLLAAMAGALDASLAGPYRRLGVVITRPWIHENGRARLQPTDIRRALALNVVMSFLVSALAIAATVGYDFLSLSYRSSLSP